MLWRSQDREKRSATQPSLYQAGARTSPCGVDGQSAPPFPAGLAGGALELVMEGWALSVPSLEYEVNEIGTTDATDDESRQFRPDNQLPENPQRQRPDLDLVYRRIWLVDRFLRESVATDKDLVAGLYAGAWSRQEWTTPLPHNWSTAPTVNYVVRSEFPSNERVAWANHPDSLKLFLARQIGSAGVRCLCPRAAWSLWLFVCIRLRKCLTLLPSLAFDDREPYVDEVKPYRRGWCVVGSDIREGGECGSDRFQLPGADVEDYVQALIGVCLRQL